MVKESPHQELKRVLAEELGLDTTEARVAAHRLRRAGLALKRLAFLQCSERELTERERGQEAELEQRFKLLCAELGCGWHFDDPRGHCAHIKFPSGRGNTMGGEFNGWGVTG